LVVMVVASTGCRCRIVDFLLTADLDRHIGCRRDVLLDVEEWSSLLSAAMPFLQRIVSMDVGDALLRETGRV